jgi:pilus assembly protein CpaB
VNKRATGIIAAAVIAIAGAILLVLYVNGAEDRALEGEELVEVLVADQDIPKGTPAADLARAVRTEKLPVKVVAAGTLSGFGPVQGLVAAVDIVEGEALLASRFTAAAELDAVRSPVAIPDGLMELTLSLSPEQTVGALIRPGDHVAVGVTFAAPEQTVNTAGLLLQKVLVVNVQGDPFATVQATDTDDRSAAPGGSLLVTFAVSGPDMERLLYANTFGVLHLSRQDPEGPEDSQQQVAETVFE